MRNVQSFIETLIWNVPMFSLVTTPLLVVESAATWYVVGVGVSVAVAAPGPVQVWKAKFTAVPMASGSGPVVIVWLLIVTDAVEFAHVNVALGAANVAGLACAENVPPPVTVTLMLVCASAGAAATTATVAAAAVANAVDLMNLGTYLTGPHSPCQGDTVETNTAETDTAETDTAETNTAETNDR
jgi:hypothetical protein